jgi:serine/threonine protein kinase
VVADVASAAQRLSCADIVLHRVISALRAAHGARLVHCDVRPSNIIVSQHGAVLVDWGLAHSFGARLVDCGVAAFADQRIFQGGVAAHPAMDAVAALYTWLAIAFGGDCWAPWATRENPASLFLARERFIEQLAEGNARVARVAEAIAKLSDAARLHDSLDVVEAALFPNTAILAKGT